MKLLGTAMASKGQGIRIPQKGMSIACPPKPLRRHAWHFTNVLGHYAPSIPQLLQQSAGGG